QTRSGLWGRLKRLATTDVGALLRKLNAEDLERIEQLLLEADLGVPATMELVAALESGVRSGKLKTEADLRAAFEAQIGLMLAGPAEPGRIATAAPPPTIILVMGVNGVGKTTTVAKLAHRLKGEGRRILLAAADTYRAGAVAQLETWAERLGLPCVSGTQGGDPAAVAFDAVTAVRSRGLDTLVIDTAGRLHTQDGLMEELRKVHRVIARQAPGAPHEVLLVLDGTVGQNAVRQGKQFAGVVAPTGIIVTKLDGTAKGGAVVALRRELAAPVRFIGVGEGIDDLEPFDAKGFARSILGSDEG
ncbi:MAG TPA: signal recognition particle-docking protein FtsY, partial [Gemmatimonadales bacterium]|nr:signal recognition particle-docking protein FtsY [Gemmatimonadales bacterium]